MWCWIACAGSLWMPRCGCWHPRAGLWRWARPTSATRTRSLLTTACRIRRSTPWMPGRSGSLRSWLNWVGCSATEPCRLCRDGSVLVTGGTGTLGGLTANHLITAHHVRHLILASRRGPHAPGAAALAAGLAGLGAHVTVAACDVSERQELERLLATIAGGHRLTGVVHAAGVLNAGLVRSLRPERTGRGV